MGVSRSGTGTCAQSPGHKGSGKAAFSRLKRAFTFCNNLTTNRLVVPGMGRVKETQHGGASSKLGSPSQGAPAPALTTVT